MSNSFEIPSINVYNNHGYRHGSFGELPLIDIKDMNKGLSLSMVHRDAYVVRKCVPGPYIDFEELFGETKEELPTQSIDDFLAASKPGENKIRIYDRDYLPVLKEYDPNGLGWLVNNTKGFDINPIVFNKVFELPASVKKFYDLSWSPKTKNSAPITPTQSQFELEVMNLLESTGVVSFRAQNLFFVPKLSRQFGSFDSSVFYKTQEYVYLWVLLDSVNKKFQPIRYIVDPGCPDPKIEPAEISDASRLAAFFADTAKQRNKYFAQQYTSIGCKR